MTVQLPGSQLAHRIKGIIQRKLGITAGVADAAMSSLATFLGGLAAAKILSDAELGVYAIFFTAFNFGQVVANNLIYVPAEVVTVNWPLGSRTRVLAQSIPLGILPSLVGALAIGVASLVAAQISSADVVVPLTITAALTTFFWPTQDHVRRMLHIDERSWMAASVSSAQLVITAIAIGVLSVLNVAPAWIPFGALAVANMLSLVIGLIGARPTSREHPESARLHSRDLIRSGGWLMVGVGTSPVTAFGVATIITFAAGPEALGFAEAARIVAHPILVLGTGLGYVMGPRIMRGALQRDISVSRHNHRRFNRVLVTAALIYAVFVGFDWPGNPMSWLVPKAYAVHWLVVATVLANVFLAAMTLVIQELTAAHRARTIAIVNMAAAPLQLAAAATAGITESFARPLSLAVGNGARLLGNWKAIAGIYESSDDSTPTKSPVDTQAPPDSGR